jgi:hypothetical protein
MPSKTAAELLAPVTEEELKEFAQQPSVRRHKPFKDVRGELRTATQEYGKDLAELVKMRYVQNHSYKEISKLTGLTEAIVAKRLEPFKPMMEDPDAVKQYRINEENLLDGAKALLIKGIVEQLSDEKRRKTVDLSRLTYGFGILFDKTRLVKNQSTANVATMTLADLVRNAHKPEIDITPKKGTEDADVE